MVLLHTTMNWYTKNMFYNMFRKIMLKLFFYYK
jgi:hypothetical protein